MINTNRLIKSDQSINQSTDKYLYSDPLQIMDGGA